MTRAAVTVGSVACLAALACAKPDAPPAMESAAATPAAVPMAAARPAGTWAPELGRFLLLPVESESIGVVLMPGDAPAAAYGGTTVTLLNAAGDTAVASATLDTLQCGDAPLLRLGGTILPGWWIGLHGHSASVIRMDSVEALSAADSARLTTVLARMGSRVTGDSQPEFKGLPFTVARARRFQAGDRVVVAAHLVRRVPQEAAPLEEHTLIVAERPLNDPNGFEIAYSLQSEGTEETAEHFEVLAAVQARDGILLLLARDRMTQSTYQVLRRSASGAWSVTWTRDFRC